VKYVKVVKFISNVFLAIGGAGVILMLVIVVADVIMRTFFSSPIIGATELAMILMLVFTTGISGAILNGRTVKVDFLVEKFPPRVRIIVDVAMYVISAAMFSMLAWGAYEGALFARSIGQRYMFLRFPHYPLRYLLAFSFLIATLATVAAIISYIRYSRPAWRGYVPPPRPSAQAAKPVPQQTVENDKNNELGEEGKS